jgi:dehydrogenase/reductase SDR family protein 12
MSPEHPLAHVADLLLEASVVGSFSKLGILARRRLWSWPDPPDAAGRAMVVTGASSGIGRSVAVNLARLGADLILLGRDEERLETTRRAAMATRGAGHVETAVLDLVDPVAVTAFAATLNRSRSRLDGLVHCAGAMFADFRTAPDGTELTLATHVVAPFRLSRLLLPLLRRAPSAIVTVSSGGMYTQPFDLSRLELADDEYRGVTAYARAKRAQVVLAHEWARRWGGEGVASYAMHPGWVDTPGLVTGLPTFARLGPLLRTTDQGADTAVWLVAHGAADGGDAGGIWLDRQRRSDAYLPTTYRRPARRRRDGQALWEWCAARVAGESHPFPA